MIFVSGLYDNCLFLLRCFGRIVGCRCGRKVICEIRYSCDKINFARPLEVVLRCLIIDFFLIYFIIYFCKISSTSANIIKCGSILIYHGFHPLLVMVYIGVFRYIVVVLECF